MFAQNKVLVFHAQKSNTFDKIVLHAKKYINEGYSIVDANTWFDATNTSKKLLITFDDGFEYLDNRLVLLLRKNKIKAISFVISLNAQYETGEVDWGFYRDNTDVFEVGSHSLCHSKIYSETGMLEHDANNISSYFSLNAPSYKLDYGLTGVEWNSLYNRSETHIEYLNRIRSDVHMSKRIIEQNIGKPCRFFAYPWGQYNQYIKTVVKDIGFSAAFSTVATDNDMFTIKRNVAN